MSRFFKRKPTQPAFSGFDKNTVQADLPSPKLKEEPTRLKTDKDKKDNDAQEDERIEEDQGKDKKDTRQAQALNATSTSTTVKDNTVKTGSSTTATFSQPALFQTFWNEETSHVLDPDVHENTNTWIPNALAMFQILNQTRTLSADHRDIQKRHTNYLDYATMVYYCYIFYIQILRARRNANVCTDNERRILKRFEQEFKLETLPIAGPLVPFFTSIVATQLDDEQFAWTAPAIDYANINGTTFATPNYDEGHMFMQPALPYVMSILTYAVHPAMTQGELSRVANAERIHWNDEDYFVPFNFTAANPTATLWGIQFDRGNAAVRNRDRLLTASGITYPFVTDIESLLAVRKSWMTSNFNITREIPCGWGAAQATTIHNGVQYNATGATATDSLDKFLLMERGGDSTFFEKLVDNATTHARCFKGMQNLSQIPTAGGAETLVLGTFHRLGADRTYADYNTILTPAAKLNWYVDPFNSLRATFNTMVANPPRAEVLQAFTFGINATLPVTGMFDPRPAIAHNRFIAPTPFTSPFRTGPIWSLSSRKMDFRDEEGQQGKDMFKYFGRVIHANLWNERL